MVLIGLHAPRIAITECNRDEFVTVVSVPGT